MTARMSFFDEEYVQGRRVPSPPPTTMELDFEPESAVNHVRNNIVCMLAQKSWLLDFKEHRVPSMQRDPQVHQELSALLNRRQEIDKELMDMLSDRDEDGKPLDPKRDFEADYQRLNQEYDNLNRTMFERYMRFLDDSDVTRERKRKHDTALSAVDAADDTPVFPYTLIASLPIPPLTSPQ
jgi:hypothetical protein